MKKHLEEVQVYSGIAILFVTLIHSNAFYVLSFLHSKSYISAGFIFNLLDKVVHVAVPMFIFIAGYKYKLNDKDETYIKIFYKKYNKVIKPFLILSILWICYNKGFPYFKNIFLHKSVSISDMFSVFSKELVRVFLGYNYAYQLWYIPMYLLIIFSYPIITKYLKNSKIRLFIFYIVAIIITIVQIKTRLLVNSYLHPINFIYYFYLYELGSLIYINGISEKHSKMIIISYLFLLPIFSLIKNPFINNMCVYLILTPLGVISFLYISLLLKENRILLILGKYSFPIYLFHEPFFISKFSRILVKYNLYKSILMIPFIAIISILLSIGLYRILIKTFIGRYMFTIPNSSKKIRVPANISMNHNNSN